MRDRDQMLATLKDFRSRGDRPGSQSSEHAGLIGGDLRRVLDEIGEGLTGPGVVDPLRDAESVAAIARAAASAPTVRMEIGAARGTFAVAMADRHPSDVLLASEVRRKTCKTLARRRARRQLETFFVMLGDIRLQLPPLLESGVRFDEIFVLFPDPWWKRRHFKRRLFNAAFLDLMAASLAPRGRLILKTDVRDYFDSVLRLVDEDPRFGICTESGVEAWLADLPTTRRQQELDAANIPHHAVAFELPETPTPPEALR